MSSVAGPSSDHFAHFSLNVQAAALAAQNQFNTQAIQCAEAQLAGSSPLALPEPESNPALEKPIDCNRLVQIEMQRCIAAIREAKAAHAIKELIPDSQFSGFRLSNNMHQLLDRCLTEFGPLLADATKQEITKTMRTARMETLGSIV
ncbi:MAG: hypothetical protein HC848_03475 [Limnobacter sp.]|nr:hypothetical protein [Limnobacter sp.]